jgi:hypothetical protein
MNQAIIKFNSGNLAILCSNCNVIIKTGVDFTKEELLFAKGKGKLEAQYCDKCKPKENETSRGL